MAVGCFSSAAKLPGPLCAFEDRVSLAWAGMPCAELDLLRCALEDRRPSSGGQGGGDARLSAARLTGPCARACMPREGREFAVVAVGVSDDRELRLPMYGLRPIVGDSDALARGFVTERNCSFLLFIRAFRSLTRFIRAVPVTGRSYGSVSGRRMGCYCSVWKAATVPSGRRMGCVRVWKKDGLLLFRLDEGS